MFEIIIENNTLTQDDLNRLEINYIKQYNSIVPNGYNIQKGGNNESGYRQVKNIIRYINPKDYDQPIINIKTNKEYINSVEWIIQENLNPECIYDLYFLKGDYRFKNLNEISPYYGEGYSETTTLQDILDGKAVRYVLLPVININQDNQDEKIEKNTNDIALLKKEIEQLKLENQALKENRKCKEYVL